MIVIVIDVGGVVIVIVIGVGSGDGWARFLVGVAVVGEFGVVVEEC